MALSTYTHTVTQASVPLGGAYVWVSDDALGANVVASGYTDTNGQVVFTLAEGDYYVWCQRARTTFPNPTAETVTAPTDSGSTDGTAAAGAGYATLADLKAAIAPSGTFTDTTDDTLLQDCLDAAADWINHRTGRLFVTAATGDRVYYPTESNRLAVDDAATVTAVAIDQAQDGSYSMSVASSEWELLPLNLGTPGVLGQASQIHLLPTSTHAFSPDMRVKVTGTWGYGSVPVGVKMACIRLAQRAYKLLREAPLGIVQAPDLGAIARVSKQDPQVEDWLAPYIQTAARWAIV